MELGYLLLAFDVVLAVALWMLARRPTQPVELRDLSGDLQRLEEARRGALGAAEEAVRARQELERALARAERFTHQWAEATLEVGRRSGARGEPAEAGVDEVKLSPSAEARIASALRALRRV